MRRTYQVFAYLVATLVVVQAMSIAYGLAGLTHWIEDGNTLTKALLDDAENSLHFQGTGGFAIHGINGMMIIPLVTILFFIISFFSKVPGGVRRAAIIVVMVALQLFLGLSAHDAPVLAPLHALNAFGIFAMAIITGRAAAVVEAPVVREQAV